MKITVKFLAGVLKRKGYVLYTKPYQLNILGIRSPFTSSNSFDDALHVFYRDEQLKWQHYVYPITTDPGTYFLKKPMQVDGTAILKEGQYKNVYRIDLHRNEYTALCQRGGTVTVMRDYDRNAYLDFYNSDKENESTGWFGINIHRARPKGATAIVDRWSAGCQVFGDADDFAEFMAMCQKHRLYYGNAFTYTLIDTRVLVRRQRRYFTYFLIGTALTGAGAAGFYLWKTREQKVKQLPAHEKS